MDDATIKQLEQLRDKYPGEDNQTRFSGWEKSLKKSSLFTNLRQHAAFKIICDGYYEELLKINKELQTNSALFKDPEGMILGRLLHERKRFIQEFFKPFETAKVVEASVKDNITNNLQEDE